MKKILILAVILTVICSFAILSACEFFLPEPETTIPQEEQAEDFNEEESADNGGDSANIETPENPDTTTNPETPENPGTTVDPENPEEQEPSIDPGEPTDPETPEEPGTATDPENPEEQEPSINPGEPTDPEIPEEPGTTTNPETPEEQEPSIDPGEPTDPETPEEPGTTVDPENPDEQEPSINPGEPTDPETPENPGTTVDPENPEEQEPSINPGEPTDPEIPEEPGTTVDPENPEEQEPSINPGEPTDPDNPENPGTTTDPENPDEQEPSIDPSEPTDPETPEEPGTTVDPENPEEQEPSINPGEPTEPENPENPGTTTDPEIPEEPEVIYYTITFVGKDGDVIAEFEVEEGAAIVPPEPKKYEGYAFLGWLQMPSVAEADVVVTGEYAKVYEVSLHMYGEDGDIWNQTLSFISGTPLSEQLSAECLSAILPVGYELPSEFADSEYYAQEVNEDMVIEIRCEKSLYKITLHKLNWEIENKYAEYGETITLSPLRAPGYLFRGWYADAACTLPYDQAEITQNIDIYSKWEEVTDESQFELASDDDLYILIDNPHAQYVVTGQIDFSKIADEGLEFTGVFDGGEYTANLGNKPLFKLNSGTIRNLWVAVNADNADLSTRDAYGTICAVNSGVIENVNISGNIAVSAETTLYVGGVSGKNNGEIKNIVLDMDIHITVSNNKRAHMGAVVGEANNSIAQNISGKCAIVYNGAARNGFGGGLYGTITGGEVVAADINLTVEISGCAVAGGIAGQATMGSVTLNGEITVSGTVSGAQKFDEVIGFSNANIDQSQAVVNTENFIKK